MLITEARVETERSSHYLVQLCSHFAHKAQAHPEIDAHVEWSDDRGVASFGWGRCSLYADPAALTLRAEAPDEESLQRQPLGAAETEEDPHMPDPSRSPDTRDDNGADTGVEPDRKSTTATSR